MRLPRFGGIKLGRDGRALRASRAQGEVRLTENGSLRKACGWGRRPDGRPLEASISGSGYDPVTGRWTAKDSKGLEGGLNLYEYAGNDPINHIDPSGQDWLDWDLRVEAEFLMGLADGMSLGLGPLARKGWDAAFDDNLSGQVSQCSGAYKAGGWASFAIGSAPLRFSRLGKGAGEPAAAGGEAPPLVQRPNTRLRFAVRRAPRASSL